jgi:hypothetical protein
VRKTITNSLVLAVSLLCLLILGACPPEASPAEDTEEVKVTGIPPTVNGKPTYKVYVQLSETTSPTADAGYVAKGEALISGAQKIGDTYTVTITQLKGQDGKPWKGSTYRSANVVIRPKKVESKNDIEAKGNLASSSKTVTLVWDNLASLTGILNDADFDLLYNGIIVADGLDLE